MDLKVCMIISPFELEHELAKEKTSGQSCYKESLIRVPPPKVNGIVVQ